MKVKFIGKFTRWLYDISHDYTISERDYNEMRNKIIIAKLKYRIRVLEKQLDVGTIESIKKVIKCHSSSLK